MTDEQINKLVLLGGAILTALCLIAATARGDDDRRDRHERRNHNYIIERQETGQVSGVPTLRRIVGKREIDIYPNGLMFEKNNVVGIEKR